MNTKQHSFTRVHDEDKWNENKYSHQFSSGMKNEFCSGIYDYERKA